MSYETISYQKLKTVGVITLNLPEKMNPLENKLLEELSIVFKEIKSDKIINAVVLTGNGKAFCSGGDLNIIKKGFTALEGRNYLKNIYECLKMIVNIEKPVIAAVNGHAIGAGFSLSLLCDIVFAASNAKFCQSFVNIGLVPDIGSMYFLPRLVGLNKAKELIFSGEMINASEAYRLGIVNKVYDDDLKKEAIDYAESLSLKSNHVIGLSKKILHTGMNISFEEFLELEAHAQSLCFQTEEHKEKLGAFFNERN